MTAFLVPGYAGLKKYKEGGGSWILRAARVKDALPVAIKVLKPELAKDKEHLSGFLLEANILHELKCRSIVRVYDFVKDAKPQPAIVMEFFDSENLKVMIYEQTDFVRKHWHRIIYELAGAFMYIHKRGIIHRDMKPENVLVAADGYAKLIDFSLAITKKAKPRKISGTPTYISPEQINRDKLTPATDMYSFGVTIYEIITGGPPFTGATTTEILDQHLKKLPLHISKGFPGLDPELASFVMRMLAKDPRNRPQDMKELLTLLKKIDPAPLAPLNASRRQSG